MRSWHSPGVDVDEVADELYGLHPDEFMAARTAREQEARADGDRSLAAEIKALGKPSAAAWACNVLVRHAREEIESLVELGGLLREAQQNLQGDQLRALDVQRRQLVSALTRQARGLAHELAHPVSTGAAQQIEETLRAAMADPEAGEALLEGRLTSPLSYSGMGLTGRPHLRVVPPPKQKPAPTPKKDTGAKARPRRDDEARREEARRAAEERRRAAEEKWRRELARAQEAAEQATAAAEEAATAAEELRRQTEEIEARRSELRARVDELADQLADAERAAAETETALKRAQRRSSAAEREAHDAAELRDRAVSHAQQLAAARSD